MDKNMIDKLVGDRSPTWVVPVDRVPSELTRLLALGCRLAHLVQHSPIEPHIKALATEFIHRANKATSNVI